MSPDLVVIDEVFPASIFAEVLAALDRTSFQFGWSSGQRDPFDRFWNSQLVVVPSHNRRPIPPGALEPAFRAAWEHLKRTILSDELLIRAYVNVTTFGLDTAPHRDSPTYFESDRTIVIGASPSWQRAWGGATVLYTEPLAQMAEFAPNRAAIFPSGLLHQALPLARGGGAARRMLVFKTRKPNAFDPFFARKGWDRLAHSGAMFSEHLWGTWAQARRLGADKVVTDAALLHAAYGTEFFSPPNKATREEVRALIGPAAEELVHAFCTTPRATLPEGPLRLIAQANDADMAARKK